MLFRAMARPDRPGAQVMVVFFQAADRFEAGLRLSALLSAVWDELPSRIDWWQLESECGLLGTVYGGKAENDGCLLKTGPCGSPSYADPRHTQLLVGPECHVRLVQAQQRLGLVGRG